MAAATATSVVYPIIGALKAAETDFKKPLSWHTVNDAQAAFMRDIFAAGSKDVSKIPELQSVSSHDYHVVNKFLQDKGFSIQLDPYPPVDIGMASVLKVLLEWQEAGKPQPLTLNGAPDGQQFPGVFLKAGVKFLKSPAHPHPVVSITAKNHDEVLLTPATGPVAADHLLATINAILSSAAPAAPEYLGVHFPMVDVTQKPDISWLKGMTSEYGFISQALQETMFAMDELGAIVKSAAAVVVTRSLPDPPFQINTPFLIAVRRPGLHHLVFAGYMDVDSWKRPQRA